MTSSPVVVIALRHFITCVCVMVATMHDLSLPAVVTVLPDISIFALTF